MQIGDPLNSERSLKIEESKVNPSNSSLAGKTLSWFHNAGLAALGSVQKALGFAPSDFAQNLAIENFQRVFTGSMYGELPSYEEALWSYREKYSREDQGESCEIARKMFHQPIWDLAYEILEPYFITDRKENASQSFADKFIQDAQIVKNALRPQVGQGTGFTAGLKLTAYASLFDSHKNGNYPYRAGCRCINGGQVHVLRHGVPVREWLDGDAILPKSSSGDHLSEGKLSSRLCNSCVSEEYRAFLDYCKGNDGKVLYNCLLNPNNKEGDERPRMEALFKLGLEEQYRDTFHFVKMPADGPITQGCKDAENLKAYMHLIKNNIESLRGWTDEDFQSWEALSKKNLEGFVPGSSRMRNVILEVYQPLLEFCYHAIFEAYKIDSKLDLGTEELKDGLKEKKQAFMMLFCTLLKIRLIQKLGITHYNNTCKDAIDRGAMHLVCDFLWDSFCTEDLKRSEDNLRVHAAWPAVMAKSQAILHDRAEWIVSFARWIDRVSAQPILKQNILTACRKHKLASDRPVNFLNSYKSESYVNGILSKLRDDFVLTQSYLFKAPCSDMQTLTQNQEPIRDLLLSILPSFLEHKHYHNIPLKRSSESVLELMNVSDDGEFICGELGFFSNQAEDCVGGPVFTIEAEGKTIGALEVALKWKIKKADLGNKKLPIELSIWSRYIPQEEVFEILEESEEEKTQRVERENIDKQESRLRFIQEKHQIRQTSLSRSQIHASSVEIQPEIASDRFELDAIEINRPSNSKIIRAKSLGDLAGLNLDESLRPKQDRKEPIQSSQNLGDFSNSDVQQLLDPPTHFHLQDLREENQVVNDPLPSPPPRVRMGRDIVMLTAGALLGSVVTIWSKVFGGFPKLDPVASDPRNPGESKDNSLQNKEISPSLPEIDTSQKSIQRKPSTSILRQKKTIFDPTNYSNEQCMKGESPMSIDPNLQGLVSISVHNDSSQDSAMQDKVYPLVVWNHWNAPVIQSVFLDPVQKINTCLIHTKRSGFDAVFNVSNSLLLKSVIPLALTNPNTVNPFSNHSNAPEMNAVDSHNSGEQILPQETIHTKSSENSEVTEMDVIDLPQKMTDTNIDLLEKDLVQDISGFSTTFKMMAGAMVGVGVVVLAVKIYRYFQEQKHKLEKMEKPVARTSLPSPLEPVKASSWVKTLTSAQDFISTILAPFLQAKRVAKNGNM